MKLNPPLAAFITAGISLIFLWSGCSNKEQLTVCGSCKPTRPEMIRDITISGQSFSAGVYKQNTSRSLLLARIQEETNTTAASFQSILNSLVKNQDFGTILAENHVPVNYNLFVSKDIRLQTTISDSDIRAVSLITYKDYGLHHYLFVRNDSGELVIRQDYSLPTDGLNVKDQYSLFNTFFSEESNLSLFTLVSTVSPAYGEVMNRVKTENELRVYLNRR